MFEKVFVEKEVATHPDALSLLERLRIEPQKTRTIDRIDDYFGRVKKPYLQKRDNLNLYIGKKRGQLVKEAPDAYGLAGEAHYYFIHAYNCIYECTYCYLQGYFQSPDMVLFINHDDILREMDELYQKSDEKKRIWYHAGEYSDSLALSHITGELSRYFDWFASHPRAMLELRTKSANIRELKKLTAPTNVVTSFSLSPAEKIKTHDLKTPPLEHRLKAMNELVSLGFPVAIHLDPVIFDHQWQGDYDKLFDRLEKEGLLHEVEYISVGVVRFTKDVFHQVKRNYPDSPFLKDQLIKSGNGLVRYPRPMRIRMLRQLEKMLLERNVSASKIYLCMES